MKNITPLQISSIIFALVTWSSSFVFIRIGLLGFSPGALALFRYLIVSAVMLIFYYRVKKRTRPNFSQAIQLFFLGFFGIGLYTIALNYGEITVSASIASFIIGMNPIVAMLFTTIVFQESISLKRWLGVGVSVIGLIVIAVAKFQYGTNDWGIAILLFAVLCTGTYNVAQKPLLKTFHPIEVAAISAWTGTLAMLVFMPSLIHQLPHTTWHVIGSGIYLGVVPGALGYIAWSYAMHAAKSASKLTLSLYTLPLFSTLLGWMMLGEMPSFYELLGGCIALLGALIATRY